MLISPEKEEEEEQEEKKRKTVCSFFIGQPKPIFPKYTYSQSNDGSRPSASLAIPSSSKLMLMVKSVSLFWDVFADEMAFGMSVGVQRKDEGIEESVNFLHSHFVWLLNISSCSLTFSSFLVRSSDFRLSFSVLSGK